ncbi:MAG: MFS transporter [Deltaproteobacteria bacterium]|nr:MFS transporter [Deltaproteobacteria bacterium]
MQAAADPSAKSFQARRTQNWVFLGLMYAMFYMGRYNFAAVNALLSDKFGWTNTDLGNIIAAGKICYGASVFFNGPLADRIGGKKAILIGAAGAAVFNFLFGLGSLVLVGDAVWSADHKSVLTPATLAGGLQASTVIALFAVVWALNHYFQSFGALSIVKINAAWFTVKERGSFAGIFGIMIQSGRTLAFAVGPLIAGALPWRWVFWVPAAFLLVLFLLNRALVENTPADAGQGELTTGDEVAGEDNTGGLGFVLRKVFANPQMWIIALASMMIGFVRNGTDDWFPKFFANVHHAQQMARGPRMTLVNIGALVTSVLVILGILHLKRRIDGRKDWSPLKRFGVTFSLVGVFFALLAVALAFALAGMEQIARATLCLTFAAVAMPIASVFGGIVSGNMSDALFGSRRAPVICGAFVGMAAVQLVFTAFPGGPLFAAWMLVLLAFFIQSAHSMVGGAASMDFGGKKAVATAAGLFDGAQYVAGAIVAQTLGHVIDRFGWGGWGLTQVPFAIVGALLMLKLWNARPGAGHHGGSPPEAKPASAVSN